MPFSLVVTRRQGRKNLPLILSAAAAFLVVVFGVAVVQSYCVVPSQSRQRQQRRASSLSCREFASSVVSSSAASRTSSLLLWSTTTTNEGAAATTTATEQASLGSVADDDDNPLGLTPELLKIANAFEAIGDDKLRYKQLLYMANQLKPMAAELQVPENKVPGCLSTVHVHATASTTTKVNGDVVTIDYSGDSDGLLTKGLVALLVRGLSGNSAAAIQKVDPTFIQKAGIAASLTPGRNNGFLNMLAVMKRKALELEEEAAAGASATTAAPGGAGGGCGAEQDDAAADGETDAPMYNAIAAALETLRPVRFELADVSKDYGAADDNAETHFDLAIVSDAFDGLNVVKRQRLIYMLLGANDLMSKIEALQIRALTPQETGL